MASEIQAIGQYRLYILPGEAGPAPEFSLPERPMFDVGIQLLGYDGVPCDGNWQLHWTPIPAAENDVPVHFFVHILDGAGQVLAQKDARSYDRQYWRDGDHIVTSFDFGRGFAGQSIDSVKIGLYSFLDEVNTTDSSGRYVMDERGQFWVYWDTAVELPFNESCPLDMSGDSERVIYPLGKDAD